MSHFTILYIYIEKYWSKQLTYFVYHNLISYEGNVEAATVTRVVTVHMWWKNNVIDPTCTKTFQVKHFGILFHAPYIYFEN